MNEIPHPLQFLKKNLPKPKNIQANLNTRSQLLGFISKNKIKS